jgi:antitoxin (DNA-binding transcriptional repressor) of toxin-antitoxin stability system
MIFTVHQAKTQLSKLIALAEAGEEVVIARGDKPVVRMYAMSAPDGKTERVPGRLKGKIALTDAFFEPMSEDELRAWEGDWGFSSTPIP